MKTSGMLPEECREEIRARYLDLWNWDTHGQPRAEVIKQAISDTLAWVLGDDDK